MTQPDRLREALSHVDVETPEGRAFIEGVAFGQRLAAPDLIAAVEALRITAPSDLSAESLFYREGWDDCLHAVLALLRSAPTSREAGLDADPDRHYHDDGCPHLPRVPWNNPKVKP